MKFSRYNVYKSDGLSTWIYNCLSSAFIKLDNAVLNTIWETSAQEYRHILQAQGIIVDDRTDETLKYKYRYYRNAFNNKKLHLCIAPTMKCNFSCFYCFEEGNKNLPVMSEEVEEALIRYIDKNKENRVSIHWFGGEPLLGSRRIFSIAGKLNRKNIGFTSSMVTNGSLLTESIIKQLDMLHLSHVQISLDGLKNIHDQRRSFKNGKPSFQLIINNIERFLNHCSIPLFIQVIVDRTNENAYEEVIAHFKEKFPSAMENKRIQIGCNYVKNRTDFEKKSACFSKNEIFEKSVENLKSGVKNALTPFLPGVSLPCMYRCTHMFAIDPAGDMYKCLEHLGNPRYKVGNLLSARLSQNKLSEAVFEEDPFDDTECKNCPVFPVCGGGCPIDRIKNKEGKRIDYCSSYKKNLAELLPYLYEYQYKKHE